jgi:hypothetical protein
VGLYFSVARTLTQCHITIQRRSDRVPAFAQESSTWFSSSFCRPIEIDLERINLHASIHTSTNRSNRILLSASHKKRHS